MKFISILLLFAYLNAKGAGPSNPTETELSQVAQSRYWHLLLHLRPAMTGGLKSSVSAGDFFLAPKGYKDPLAELKADIEAFSQNRLVGFFKQHPQCAFPERYRFLKTTLNLQIQDVPCNDFETWMNGLSPDSLTLVYSAGFENNPASVFGHTLLRINAKPKPGETKRDLLDYGVSYAAATTEESGIEFAIRGLFGGYYGAFELLPYYMKVNLYSHAENRDVWEYDLNLNPEQVRRMLAHLWELRTTALFTYYFIDENCAYQMLVLLEIAQENWHLVDRMPWYVIPGDTVKAVTAEPNAVKAVHFRPSIYKKLASEYNNLKTEKQRADFFDLVNMKKSPDEVTDVATIDAALLQFQYIKSKVSSDLNPAQTQYFKSLLIHRSRFPVDQNKIRTDWGQEDSISRPDLSHGSFQVGALGGVAQNKFTQELHFRMGLHDVMNNDMGLPRNSNFEWLGFKMRNIEKSGLTLDQVDVLNIKSIFSRNRLQKLYSWKINFQYRTPKDLNCGSCKTGFVETGGGFGTDLYDFITVYGLLGFSAEAGKDFGLGYRAGPQAEFGSIFAINNYWKLGLSFQTTYDLTDKDGQQNYSEILFEQGYALSTKWDLRTKFYWIPSKYDEAFLGANYYF